MFQQRKQKRKKTIVLTCIFVLSFFIWVYGISNQERGKFKLGNIVQDIGVRIESFFIPKMNEYDQNLFDGINQQLEEENNELKKMLELEFDNYHIVHANVISREIDWYQEIIIDKGEKDGIKQDMAVISNQGLIGRISEVRRSSSVIKLLTSNSNDMKIAVDIQTETEAIHGIINGYLHSESSISIDSISKNSDIKIGDKVYTNGLGGIYPSGIYIGQIVEIDYDSLGLNKIAKVKSDSSYDVLRYVTIIDRGKKE